MPIHVCLCASLVTSALGSCVLLRCKKWRCDKHSSGDVACKHQSFGRCTVSKLAVYSPRPSHTPLSGLRLIVRRFPYEEQLIYTESNCKRPESGVEKKRRLSDGERGKKRVVVCEEGERSRGEWERGLCVIWYIFTGIKTHWKINDTTGFVSEWLIEFSRVFNWDKLSTKAHRDGNEWQMRKAGRGGCGAKARENWLERGRPVKQPNIYKCVSTKIWHGDSFTLSVFLERWHLQGIINVRPPHSHLNPVLRHCSGEPAQPDAEPLFPVWLLCGQCD